MALAFGAVGGWATWPLLAGYAAPASPLLVLGLAAMMSFVVTLASALARRRVRAAFSIPPKTIAIVAAGLAFNNLFYLIAIGRIGPAEANVVHYLWPIFLLLLVCVLRRRLPAPLQLLGVALAFTGAAIAIGPQFSGGLDVLGLIAGLSGALTFAVYSTLRSRGTETTDVIGPSMGVIAVFALVGHGLSGQPTDLDTGQWMAIALIGAVPLTLSNRLWDRALRSGEVASITAIPYLNPLLAVMLLAVFSAASLPLTILLAAALTVSGALLAARG